MDCDKKSLDDEVEVTITMTRRDLNRLSHVMQTEGYDRSVLRASLEKVATYRQSYPGQDSDPFENTIDVEDS